MDSFQKGGPCGHLKDLVKIELLVPLGNLSVGNSFMSVLDNLAYIYIGYIGEANLSLRRTPSGT